MSNTKTKTVFKKECYREELGNIQNTVITSFYMFVCIDMLRYGTCKFILKLCSYNCQSSFKCK